jgi:hypothetical protein
MKLREVRVFLLFLLFLTASVSISFAQGSNGIIEGRVINRTLEKPVSGIKVSLDIVRRGQRVDGRETVSDNKGGFKFEGLPLGEEYSFIAYTQFEGASYEAQTKLTEKTPQAKLTINVYNSSTDPSKVIITEYYVQVETSGTVRVTEFINIDNTGKTSFALDNSNKEKPLGLILTLPENFQNIQMLEGLMQCCSKIEGNKIYSYMSLPPGKNRVVFSYELSGKEVNLTKEAPFKTNNFYLIVADPKVKVSTNKLAFQGLQEHETTPFQLYWAGNLKKGEVVDVLLSNLPSKRSYLAIVLILAVILGVVIFSLFIRQKKVEGEAELEEEAEVTGESEDLKRIFLEFVVILDRLFEEGEISEEVYKRLRNEYKEKLAHLLEGR